MAGDWRCFEVPGGPPAAFDAAFRPIVRIRSSLGAVKKPGSGFLIHPRFVVTAAHVVMFDAAPEPLPATEIAIDTGNAGYLGAGIAVQRGYFGMDQSLLDVAVIRLESSACGEDETCVIRPIDLAQQVQATIVGFMEAKFVPFDAIIRRVSAFLEYPSPDLPGLSGGPAVTGFVGPRPLVAGLHYFHDATRGVGKALSLVQQDVDDAIQQLMQPRTQGGTST